MASRANGYRLIELPPELRNKIYLAFFEDTAPVTIDVLSAHSCIPERAITKVSRQMRKETLLLFETVRRAFWRKHVAAVHVEGTWQSTFPALGITMYRACKALQMEPIVKVVVHAKLHDGNTVGVNITVTEEGRVEVNATSAGAMNDPQFVAESWRAFFCAHVPWEARQMSTQGSGAAVDMMKIGKAACLAVGCCWEQ